MPTLQEWGKCSEQFMVENNYCSATCGRCSSSEDGNIDGVQSFGGPAGGSGNRKLLARATAL